MEATVTSDGGRRQNRQWLIAPGGNAMSSSLRETWEEASSNPDPETDLGYEHEPLTAVHVEEDSEQYIFLPGEEAHLSDAEFIIADPDSVHSLGDRR